MCVYLCVCVCVCVCSCVKKSQSHKRQQRGLWGEESLGELVTALPI